MPVKTPATCTRTKRPKELYYSLVLVFGVACVGYGGDCEAGTLMFVGSLLK